jgi:hypothetical protein
MWILAGECVKQKSPRELMLSRAFDKNPGDFLLSHAVSRAVPSAPAGLTSVFGMGTGVTLPTKSPENFLELCTLTFVLCVSLVGLTNKAQRSKYKAQKSNSDCLLTDFGKLHAQARVLVA